MTNIIRFVQVAIVIRVIILRLQSIEAFEVFREACVVLKTFASAQKRQWKECVRRDERQRTLNLVSSGNTKNSFPASIAASVMSCGIPWFFTT